MAIGEIEKQKKLTYGVGLMKGLGVTLRHLFSRSVTIHYPDEKPLLPARSRGVIALKEENCTVCMLCARECPDWCIYIEGHKEERKPKQEGKRAKKYNVLDRFAIDYALCMYCGICVDVCPYDALFWTPEFEYAEHDVVNLTHEMQQLSDWMYTVLPPPPLDEGALGPVFKTAARPAATSGSVEPSGSSAVAQETRTAPQAPAPEASPSVGPDGPSAASTSEAVQTPAPDGRDREGAAAGTSTPTSREGEEEGPSAGGVEAPARDERGEPVREGQEAPMTQEAAEAVKGVSAEEAAEIRKRVLEEELAKGSDPRVAEGRAKAAEMRAKLGTKGPGE